jgi:hypothetical protein
MRTNVITALCVLFIAPFVMAASPAPAVEARLVQISPLPDITFGGPVNVQYQLTIRNPLVDRSIRVRRVTLRTEGGGAYSMRSDDPLSVVINPENAVTVSFSAWGRSNGGLMRRRAPVDMVIQLWFDRQNGKSFVKQFVQNLPQS